jgi:hypothetical protein
MMAGGQKRIPSAVSGETFYEGEGEGKISPPSPILSLQRRARKALQCLKFHHR